MRTVKCPYCRNHAEFVTGREIYPHRPDLAALRFWRCRPCKAWVQCHKPNPRLGIKGSDKPMGRLANLELRTAKIDAHRAFDQLWKPGGPMARPAAYKWLAEAMGMPPKKCHIGMFDIAECHLVVKLSRAFQSQQSVEES